jgi:hypothetical protein
VGQLHVEGFCKVTLINNDGVFEFGGDGDDQKEESRQQGMLFVRLVAVIMNIAKFGNASDGSTPDVLHVPSDRP